MVGRRVPGQPWQTLDHTLALSRLDRRLPCCTSALPTTTMTFGLTASLIRRSTQWPRTGLSGRINIRQLGCPARVLTPYSIRTRRNHTHIHTHSLSLFWSTGHSPNANPLSYAHGYMSGGEAVARTTSFAILLCIRLWVVPVSERGILGIVGARLDGRIHGWPLG